MKSLRTRIFFGSELSLRSSLRTRTFFGSERSLRSSLRTRHFAQRKPMP